MKPLVFCRIQPFSSKYYTKIENFNDVLRKSIHNIKRERKRKLKEKKGKKERRERTIEKKEKK